MTLRSSGLTARAMLVTCTVAIIAVVVTALVALPLGLRAAQSEARGKLESKTEIATAMLGTAPGQQQQLNIVRRLRASRIDIVLVLDGKPDRPGLPIDVIRDVSIGKTVDCKIVLFQGRRVIADGRPLNTPGDAIVLLEPAISTTSNAVWGRLWLALGAGLLAGLVAGFMLARRQAKPIRDAAAAARRMSAGDRTVRLPVEPPDEVADLARALNDLAAALATSEGRQRDFLMSVSHELRTPLTTIRGYAEALSDGVISDDGTFGAGRTILAEADRLDRLVSDLLSLARLEAADFPVELVAVELGSLVQATAEAWRPRCLEVGLDLRTELPSEPVLVNTDPGRLRQVVDILVSNAVRALPTGAPLVLSARYDVLEVRDGGPGLADEDLAVAFHQGVLHEKYRDVRPVGSGLGLALAARLISRMGAKIEAGHAPEGGARFTIRF
ncbi:sensor histidine kinase [Longispora sp. NPDC051575]|uniref:sensor histidine kinase n=1 Tax=Longispora sp. NPDC051575 TaxID=3154943 RepID=UPI0034394C88